MSESSYKERQSLNHAFYNRPYIFPPTETGDLFKHYPTQNFYTTGYVTSILKVGYKFN